MSRPTLCLDYDGVMTTMASGWQGIDVCPDPPVPGLWAFLEAAWEHFDLTIHSSRSAQTCGRVAMQRWCIHHLTEAGYTCELWDKLYVWRNRLD